MWQCCAKQMMLGSGIAQLFQAQSQSFFETTIPELNSIPHANKCHCY
jgi:hypothetical protein